MNVDVLWTVLFTNYRSQASLQTNQTIQNHVLILASPGLLYYSLLEVYDWAKSNRRSLITSESCGHVLAGYSAKTSPSGVIVATLKRAGDALCVARLFLIQVACECP